MKENWIWSQPVWCNRFSLPPLFQSCRNSVSVCRHALLIPYTPTGGSQWARTFVLHCWCHIACGFNNWTDILVLTCRYFGRDEKWTCPQCCSGISLVMQSEVSGRFTPTVAHIWEQGSTLSFRVITQWQSSMHRCEDEGQIREITASAHNHSLV